MQFGVFFEDQLQRACGAGADWRLFEAGLHQAELADRLGFDLLWETEHHALDEHPESTAPDVFLAACSQRTRHIRLGHGLLMPPAGRHPACVAERIATLDLVSDGRIEWGAGEGTRFVELGWRAPEEHGPWAAAVRQTAEILCATPFATPRGDLKPRPVQKPHPPLWAACGRRGRIHAAARLGIGALTFASVDPKDARRWVDEYYRVFKDECEPVGRGVNPNVALVIGFLCHEEEDLAAFEEAGVDQIIFMHQTGIGHEHICESLELFASDVLPAFKERHESRARRKAQDLAPYIERAIRRIPALPESGSTRRVRGEGRW